VRLEEVAVTAKPSMPVFEPFAGGVIAEGGVQVTPGGKDVGQTTVTGELKPFTEVIVIVAFTVAPVEEFSITGLGVAATVNEPGAVTLKALLMAEVRPVEVAVRV
jgi:hypothetical protein